MKANRFAAAAVLAAAALTLTACGPDDTTASGGSSASAAAPAGSGSPSAAASDSAKPVPAPGHSTAPSGSAKPGTPVAKPSKSSGATPTSDCTARGASVGQVVEATDNGYLTHIWMKAKPAKFVCGPDIPDDGYFEGYGTPAVYSFSNDVKTFLLKGATPQSVDLDTFMKHQDACLHNPQSVAAPYHCYGNKYVVTLTGQNEVTSITELYHP